MLVFLLDTQKHKNYLPLEHYFLQSILRVYLLQIISTFIADKSLHYRIYTTHMSNSFSVITLNSHSVCTVFSSSFPFCLISCIFKCFTNVTFGLSLWFLWFSCLFEWFNFNQVSFYFTCILLHFYIEVREVTVNTTIMR